MCPRSKVKMAFNKRIAVFVWFFLPKEKPYRAKQQIGQYGIQPGSSALIYN